MSSQVDSRLLTFLRRVAPFSVVDRGIAAAAEDAVLESARSGNRITGVVRGDNNDSFQTSIQISQAQDASAECSCCSREEMQEQWCVHAVALLWQAQRLGFFEPLAGFSNAESTVRMNLSSPEQIAQAISDVQRFVDAPSEVASYRPNVELALDVQSDRLGVQLFFDGVAQHPAVFETLRTQSARALDNILVRALEEEGSWDQSGQRWYINSSKGIELVIGIAQEYSSTRNTNSNRKLSFSREFLGARLFINWQATSAEISMAWVLPEGHVVPREHDPFGSGPFWTEVNDMVYRLSPTAARIASLFPFAKSITVPRTQLSAILETLEAWPEPFAVAEKNAELRPRAEVKSPQASVSFELRDVRQEHFSSSQRVEAQAQLSFDYPAPPAKSNVVYIPDRAFERSAREKLEALGLRYDSERKRFFTDGDSALDLTHGGRTQFDPEWKLIGFDEMRSRIKFAELSLNVSMTPGEKAKKGEAMEWFDCSLTLTQNRAAVPISMLFKNARTESERWVRLDNGAYARVPGGSLTQLKTMLGILEPNFKLSNVIKTRLSTAQAISFSRMDDERIELALDKRITALAEKLRSFGGVTTIDPNKSFTGKLRSYQAEGLSWLSFLDEYGLAGILADEMGLGKTVQALAFLQRIHEAEKKRRRPSLIVAPTSVITNWVYEIKRFTPNLSVLLLHGPQRRALFESISKYDLVITSYALLRLDRADLEKHSYRCLLLDEAQNIKNYQAATTRAAKALRAEHRLAMTGTPTENRPLELWSIMDFLMPGYLGSVDYFRNYIEKPILEGNTSTGIGAFLNQRTRPFILRRTKAQVEKDLPPKIESVLHVEMTPAQAQLYAQILEEVRPRVFEAVKEKGIRGASVSILAALLRLRQVCNHPNSIGALRELPGYDSGKFNLLKELTEEALESNRKILLFSQFRDMLSIIREHLESRGVNYLYLDGSTNNRQDLIDKFNSDDEVRLFLISLKAGGTGLNLTAADTVIIYDPWWNPAVENQAVDRAHRIGQKKAVSVYRLVTENSVEQKIMDLKSKKAKLVEALIDDNGLSTVKLTMADLESLFSPLPAPERPVRTVEE